ncbi:hypothetical protein GWI33_002866 [Rhynchophorus ferrugineus]|uniref:CFA20 domain-containing protein n=1 Tax=Rhynchophorus ferrugineus TaxID=354439 RepID=A0A834IMI4_RHYFE|nr:hypothetical protein GWI33_002866 [Rhynchophorus ferrugineus]
MFANSYQSGFISIFFSVGSNPLAIWDKQVKNGHIRRVIDDEVKSLVLDIGGTNVATTYITCPIKPRASLGVKLPYLVMIIKNMKKYFTFEIQILDDKEMRRRFRVSNFQSTTKVRPFCTTMPIGLSAGWNQVQFNLADFTKRAYGSIYIETTRVQIHANVRIRRIYFTDQLHTDEELPNEFKLFASGPGGKTKPKDKGSKEAPAGAAVPPIKIEKTEEGDQEVPPPPSPAEESPTAKDETQGEYDQVIKITRTTVVEEGVPVEDTIVIEEKPQPEEEQTVGVAPDSEQKEETVEEASKQEDDEVKPEEGVTESGEPPTDESQVKEAEPETETKEGPEAAPESGAEMGDSEQPEDKTETEIKAEVEEEGDQKGERGDNSETQEKPVEETENVPVEGETKAEDIAETETAEVSENVTTEIPATKSAEGDA